MTSEAQPLRLEQEGRNGGWRLPLLVAAAVGLAVLGGIIWLGPPTPQNAAPAIPAVLPPLSAEETAYLAQIAISGLDLSLWQNFLGQAVVYLDGSITNRGNRRIVALELTVEFEDVLGQTVLRETRRALGRGRASALAPRPTPLAAGESRSFRVAFEQLPPDWNRGRPQVRVSGLLLD
jgi:hypothetical protein